MDWELLLTKSDTNSAWTIFKTTIEEVTTKHIPLKSTRKFKNDRCAQSPLWLDKDARLAIQKKNKNWKKYKYSRSPIAYQKYASSRQEWAKAIKHSKKSYEKKVASEVKNNNKSFWRYVNSKRKTKDTIGALTKPDDSETETNEDKADVLNTFFSSVFVETEIETDEHIEITDDIEI